MSQVTEKQVKEFIRGYLSAALFFSSFTPCDEDGNETGDTIEGLSGYEWAEGQAESLHEECQDFIQAQAADLLEYVAQIPCDLSQGTPWDYAGHDFWLTRNGHGVGYWDRGLGQLGERLTAASKAYGGKDLYLGDDELVYVY